MSTDALAPDKGRLVEVLEHGCNALQERAEELCAALQPTSDVDAARETFLSLSWLLERLTALSALKGRVAEMREAALLRWMEQNLDEHGMRCTGFQAGDVYVWETTEKKTRLRGAGAGETRAEQNAASKAAMQRALSALLQALGAVEPERAAELLAPYLSTSALLHGSAKAVMTDDEWDRCWEVVEPKRLASSSKPPKKLGIAPQSVIQKHHQPKKE